jgi:hypothetical protein
MSDMTAIVNRDHKYFVWDRNFLETTRIITNITTSYIEVVNRLIEIENKARSFNTTFDELVELSYQLVCRLPVPIVELDVPFVIRSRQGYSSEGKTFSCVGDLSYNPVIEKIQQGRFNISKEPVFYACVPCQTPNGNTALSAILESYKELLDKNAPLDDRFATVSRWDIKKTFMVVNFSMYDQAQKNNLSIKRLNVDFIRQTLQAFTPESFETFLLLCKFMSEKAASKRENDSDYLITNAYKKALENIMEKLQTGLYIQVQ